MTIGAKPGTATFPKPKPKITRVRKRSGVIGDVYDYKSDWDGDEVCCCVDNESKDGAGEFVCKKGHECVEF